MKINLKTISNTNYSIEIEPTATVDNLKDKIAASYDFVKDQIVLIYNKNILSNNQKLSSIKYDSRKYMVIHKQIKIFNYKKARKIKPLNGELLKRCMLVSGDSISDDDDCIYDERPQDSLDDMEEEEYEEDDFDDEDEEDMELDSDVKESTIFYSQLDANQKKCFDKFRTFMPTSKVIELFKEHNNNPVELYEIFNKSQKK